MAQIDLDDPRLESMKSLLNEAGKSASFSELDPLASGTAVGSERYSLV